MIYFQNKILCIDDSFMSDEFKVAYKELIKNRFERIS